MTLLYSIATTRLFLTRFLYASEEGIAEVFDESGLATASRIEYKRVRRNIHAALT